MESFFAIANHKLTIVEADGEYTKPFTTNRVMLGPGQTLNLLVTADQQIGRYSMAMGPYMSAQNNKFQNISSLAYFQYLGAMPNSIALPAPLPLFNDNLAIKTVMDGLRSLNTIDVPKEIDSNLFITVGLNVQKCRSKNPKQNCQGINGGVMAASMNNISFIRPNVSVLQAYYEKKTDDHFTKDYPGVPLESAVGLKTYTAATLWSGRGCNFALLTLDRAATQTSDMGRFLVAAAPLCCGRRQIPTIRSTNQRLRSWLFK